MNDSKGNKIKNLDVLSKYFLNFERKNVYLNKISYSNNKLENSFNLANKSYKHKLYKNDKKVTLTFNKHNIKVDKPLISLNSNISILNTEESKILGLN